MTLGEALTLRSKQAQRLNELRNRINGSVVVQEGDEPAENAEALMGEFTELSREYADLVRNIAMTNASTFVDGELLLELLQRRDHLIRLRGMYKGAADGTSLTRQVRYGRAEIKFVSVVDGPALREQEQKTDENIRVLDALIQNTNWKTELVTK